MAEGTTRSTYRHRLPVRIMHWTNVLCLFVLIGSGLQIFVAHPALYWGNAANFARPALSLTGKRGPGGSLQGVTQVGSWHVDSTGLLGVSKNMMGTPVARAFPTWATIPGARNLAQGRRWHFFFAWLFVLNGLAYWLWSWRARHLREDLLPTGPELGHIGESIVEHAKFKHPTGEAALRYNVLQKLAYLAVIFVLAPGIVLMGLAMSPHMDSVLGWLVTLVGGRQSARTIHFIFCFAFIGFIAVHLFMVLVTGPLNQIRAMITGRYRVHETPTPTPALAPEAPHVAD
jgi:thiosulfate reductase cytochrome b subunit